MFRTLSLILSGNLGVALLSLVRNLLIARLISVENYGIAATFAMAMSVVEMLSTLGMQQQIVQARDGNAPDFQAGLQGFHLLRGLIAGATLFFAAGWIAAFLGIPELAWAYQLLALVPVVNGLQHFDIHRLKREMRFGPEILTQALPMLASLAVVWPAWLWMPDYRVMLVAIGVQIVLMLAMSHLVAERRYRLSLDRTVIMRALRFGWPLLVNNLLLFLVFNGEKLIVGRELGMVDLGILAMGFTLTLTPTLVLAKVIQSFFLPQLSAAQDDADRFRTLAIVTLQAALLNGCLVITALVLVGEPLVDLLLGEKYAALTPLLIWIGILNTLRVFKSGSAVVALARGQTANAMIANLFRVASLPFSAWAAISGQGLLTIIAIATLGEILGVFASYLLVSRRAGVGLRPLLAAFCCAGLLVGFSALFAGYGMMPQGWQDLMARWAIAVACFAMFGALVYTLREGRRYLASRLATGFKE